MPPRDHPDGRQARYPPLGSIREEIVLHIQDEPILQQGRLFLNFRAER